MPLQARWAEPVSRTPVPHGQRATQPVRVHDEHRTTIGSAFDRLTALEREEARALFTELDCSGNRQRHSGCPVRTGTGPSPHSAPSHRREGSVPFHNDPARQIQLCAVSRAHDAREHVTHMSKGQAYG